MRLVPKRSAAQPVTGMTAAQRQRVAGDDPLDLGQRRVKRDRQVIDRDVDDRRVEDRHDRAEHDDAGDDPRLAVERFGLGRRCGCLGHVGNRSGPTSPLICRARQASSAATISPAPIGHQRAGQLRVVAEQAVEALELGLVGDGVVDGQRRPGGERAPQVGPVARCTRAARRRGTRSPRPRRGTRPAPGRRRSCGSSRRASSPARSRLARASSVRRGSMSSVSTRPPTASAASASHRVEWPLEVPTSRMRCARVARTSTPSSSAVSGSTLRSRFSRSGCAAS